MAHQRGSKCSRQANDRAACDIERGALQELRPNYIHNVPCTASYFEALLSTTRRIFIPSVSRERRGLALPSTLVSITIFRKLTGIGRTQCTTKTTHLLTNVLPSEFTLEPMHDSRSLSKPYWSKVFARALVNIFWNSAERETATVRLLRIMIECWCVLVKQKSGAVVGGHTRAVNKM